MNVVICTHGRCKLIRRTLESLALAHRPQGFESVWVIENGSNSGTKQVCDQLQDRLPLKYIHLKQKGKSRALQYALDQIKRGLVVFTDDDVRVNEQFFTAYAEAAAREGDGAFFGGPVWIDYQQPPPQWLLPKLPPSVLGWQLDDPTTPIEKASFLGANYGAFVESLNNVGGFKAHLGTGSQGDPVGEEFEIQDRLLANRCRGIYLPEAEVWHYVPRSRCTPRWTLRRHERIWFTSAMTGNKYNEKPWLFGAPRWMWRRLLWLGMKALAANVIPDAHRRFEAQLLYYQWRGTIRGVRVRHTREHPGGDARGGAANG